MTSFELKNKLEKAERIACELDRECQRYKTLLRVLLIDMQRAKNKKRADEIADVLGLPRVEIVT